MRRKAMGLFLANLVSVSVLWFAIAPASADYNPVRNAQTDGGLADGWHSRWTVRPGLASPSDGHALFHMIFSVQQRFANQNTNMFFLNGNVGTAFEEVGETVGPLNYSGTSAVQFYWATCSRAARTDGLCDLSTDYFEGPMAGTGPALVVGHLYEFWAVGQTHTGNDYWWDLFIRDQTIGGQYGRAGGTALGSPTMGCCSSASFWGGEGDGGSAHGTTVLPATNGDWLWYKPTGNPNYYYWGPSTRYPAGGGGGPCQADDAVTDNTVGGCQDGPGGLSDPPGMQHGYWNVKYNDFTYWR